MMPFVCDGLNITKPHSWLTFCYSAQCHDYKQLGEKRFYLVLCFQATVHL